MSITTPLTLSIRWLRDLVHQALLSGLLLYFIFSGDWKRTILLQEHLKMVEECKADDASLIDLEMDEGTAGSECTSVESMGDDLYTMPNTMDLIDLTSPAKCRVKTKKKRKDGTQVEVVCGQWSAKCRRPKHQQLQKQAGRRAEPRVYRRHTDDTSRKQSYFGS